jgi:hypothetical protein
MIGQVLYAAGMKTEITNCHQDFQVRQSIGSGTGTGMDNREKLLTAPSSRCHVVADMAHNISNKTTETPSFSKGWPYRFRYCERMVRRDNLLMDIFF